MARLSPEQGRIIGDNLFICWVLIIFNGGNGLTKCSNIHKFSFSPPNFLFFCRSPHRFILSPSSKSRATQESFAVPQHPFFSPSCRGSSHTGWREGSLFLLLRRSTNSASHAKHYCSDGEPILVGAPSTIAWRAKHYYSVAPSPLHLQPHRKRCHGQSKGAQ